MDPHDMPRYALPRAPHSVAWLLVLILLVAAGCRARPKYATATVSGKITIDGVPVPKGAITFTPLRGTTGASVGSEIKAGQYRCSLVPRGKLNVTFIAHAAEPTTMIEKATGATREVPRDILPPAYADGVPVEVTGDRSDLNFDLKSAGP
jgi:hypothetical protein